HTRSLRDWSSDVCSSDLDNALPIVGLAVSDPDAGNGIIRVTLSVLHGTLTLTPGATTVVAGALGTATFTLEGSQTDISAALATQIGRASCRESEELRGAP